MLDDSQVIKQKSINYYQSNIATISTRTVPPATPSHKANADTGTTGNYFAIKDITCLYNVQPITNNNHITVQMPNGHEIKSTATGWLKYPNVPGEGIEAHIFNELCGSLLDIGALCDMGLLAIYTSEAVYIINPDFNEVVLTGTRDADTRLWMIALTPITLEQEKAALTAAQHMPAKDETTQKPASYMNATSIQKLDTAGDRVEFFSRVFSSPAESTILRAVKKRWIRFPGITDRILRRHKHRLRTPESAAGHLDQVQQNQQRQERQHNPSKLAAEEHTLQHIDIVTYVHREENHMDATARFTTPSHDGHEYTLIMVAIQGNYIHAELMKTRHKSSYLSAHQAGLQFFEDRGYAPTFQRLDNETSQNQ